MQRYGKHHICSVSIRMISDENPGVDPSIIRAAEDKWRKHPRELVLSLRTKDLPSSTPNFYGGRDRRPITSLYDLIGFTGGRDLFNKADWPRLLYQFKIPTDLGEEPKPAVVEKIVSELLADARKRYQSIQPLYFPFDKPIPYSLEKIIKIFEEELYGLTIPEDGRRIYYSNTLPDGSCWSIGSYIKDGKVIFDFDNLFRKEMKKGIHFARLTWSSDPVPISSASREANIFSVSFWDESGKPSYMLWKEA